MDGLPRVFGIVGRSGSGKTTLIEAMLPILRGWGVRSNVIKHSHHPLQLEPPGKDSARFRAAGAQEVMVASPYRFAIFHDLHDETEPTLAEQMARLMPADLTLVEGFKREAIPKLEVHRPGLGLAPLYREDASILAVASDVALNDYPLCLALDDPKAVALYLCTQLGLTLRN